MVAHIDHTLTPRALSHAVAARRMKKRGAELASGRDENTARELENEIARR